ncbi:hypothetical protein K0M31_004280 [Melipona bicolor]|uniref:Uncharacterized protein n=1 Tax=Melipona bicolor TaxID=60889 RepID=A0AA40FWS2_9HYME|nr:hypothetical protein K0M31_004280 [Melipona bicolor]
MFHAVTGYAPLRERALSTCARKKEKPTPTGYSLANGPNNPARLMAGGNDPRVSPLHLSTA